MTHDRRSALDTRLLAILERSFAKHAGADDGRELARRLRGDVAVLESHGSGAAGPWG
jgi:hypothetical protein